MTNLRLVEPLPEIDQVHVWRIALDSADVDLPRCLGILSSDELARANRLRFPSDRNSYVRTRAIARELLAGYCGLAPAALTFDYGPAGKPRLADRDAPRFNISHSGMLAVVAIAQGEVGIDVERRKPPIPEVSQTAFSTIETHQIRSADDPLIAFYDTWTRKEALVKAIGAGLGESLSGLVVGHRGEMTIHGFHVQSLNLGTEYSAAVAMERAPAEAPPHIIIRDAASRPDARENDKR